MNIYNFVKSELKVIAGENLDISSDLEQHQTNNNIRELLVNEEKKEEKNNKEQKENTSEK